MPTVTSDLLKSVLAGVRTDFDLAYRKRLASSIASQIATVIPTTLPTQDYAWLSATPAMREWVDERMPKALKEFSYTISDKKWEDTLAIKRTAIEDEQYGMLRIRTQQLAQQVALHKSKICVQQYALGATTVCADGQYLIDTDHAESGSNQSNKTTSALSIGTLGAGIAAMLQFTDDQGEIMGISPTHLMVGPKLDADADVILRSPSVYATGLASTSAATNAGTANPMQGRLQKIVAPWLTGTYDDYWFILDLDSPVRGVILQERSDVPVEFAALDNPNTSDMVFTRDEYQYGVRARYNVGMGLWQTVYGGIL